MTLCSLKKKKDFLEVKKKGTRYVGSFLFVEIAKGNKSSYLGIAASKKYGNACTRNRFKRQIREAARVLFSTIPINISLVIYPKKEAQKQKMPSLKKDLEHIVTTFLKNHETS